jgi:XTP/dITP diphosphohydrolase
VAEPAGAAGAGAAPLLLATTNRGKLGELREMLAGIGVPVLGLDEVEAPEAPEETGASFEDNARLKARYYRDRTGLWVLADDSGLCVEALDGAPGVGSARFLGEDRPYPERHRAILERLGPGVDRAARFVCVLVLAAEDGRELVARGEVEGRIAEAPRGTGGFGYDPIFELPGLGLTFGELGAEHKARLSHRGRALAELLRRLPAFLSQDPDGNTREAAEV